MGGFFDAWTKCIRGELERGVLLISFGRHPEQARHVGLDKNDLLMEVPFEERIYHYSS